MRQVIVIILVCLTLTYIWFSRDLLFAGGEEGIPFYNISRTVKLMSFAWIDEGTGYPGVGQLTSIPYYRLLEILFNLKIHILLIQALHFFFLMSLGTVAYYFLLKITIGEELKFVPLIGAIFYLLNPFSMTQIFGRGLYIQYFAFALMPLFLTLFILGIKSKNLLYGFIALIPALILSFSYGNYVYIVAIWFLVLLYSILHLKNNKKDIRFVFIFLLLTFFCWLVTNMFWILPVFKTAPQQLSSNLNALEENLGSLRGVSKQFPLPVLIRLMHTGYFYEDLYGTIYSNFFFNLISWLIPLVSIFSLSKFKKIPHFKFYASLSLISLFVCLGSNFPTGWLFELIFKNISYFQMFRNPYEKFGLIFLMAYTPFFAIGATIFSQKIANLLNNTKLMYITLLGIIFLICGIYVWPMWKGIFAGGYRINTWIKIPDYYADANNWLNQQKGDFRLMQLPLIRGDGIRYKWGGHPYQGIEPSEFLFDRTSIAQNIPMNKNYYNVLMQGFGIFEKNIFGPDPDITHSDFRSDNLHEELAKLNIQYIVLHNDIDLTFGGFKSPAETKDYLSKQDKIMKVQTFGDLELYKVDIPDITLIYSPQTKVTYQKISPSLYTVKVTDVDKPIDLYFLSLFNPNWEATIESEKLSSHYQVFSYANAWKIDKSGNYEVILRYTPQDLVEAGMKITNFSVLVISLLSLIYLIYRWKLKRT